MSDTLAHIVQLPVVLANQIAAGEVVERPASVIKELLENAIDAGARRIRVDVEEGGVRLMRVADDGTGIAADELRLALARHATSKLTSFDDLTRVTTLGFRGEALPSIASVARLRLVSRRAGAADAWQLEVDGAAVDGEPTPARLEAGTTVEVRDLFFNTPARRRFLRAARTEYLHIETVVRRAALATPGVAFELWRDGHRTLRARANADGEPGGRRLADLCGQAFARQAVAFDASDQDLRVYGWLLASSDGRAHADLQHLCVNARVVRDATLRHALRAAFEGLLVEGRHPAYVVYVELPRDAVDVNVHPTKHELRFRDLRMVHDFVLSAARRALAGGQVEALGDAASVGPVGEAPTGVAEAPTGIVKAGGAGPGNSVPMRHGGGAVRGWRDVAAYAPLARPAPARTRPPDPQGALAPVWLTARYALLEMDGAQRWLVDLAAVARHAAAEEFVARDGGEHRVTQPLLLPAAQPLDADLAEHLEGSAADLDRLGLQIRITGPSEAVLMEVPATLAHVEPGTLWELIVGWSRAPRGHDRTPARLVARLVDAAGADAVAADRARRQDWLARAHALISAGGEVAELVRRVDDDLLAGLFSTASSGG